MHARTYRPPQPHYGPSLNSLRVLEDERRGRTVRDCYRAANVLVFLLIIGACVPFLGFSAWILAAPICLILVVLAIVMCVFGGVGKGILTIFFAFVILPAWVFAAPIVMSMAYNQFTALSVISKELKRRQNQLPGR